MGIYEHQGRLVFVAPDGAVQSGGNTFTADDTKANITAVEAEYTTLDQTFNVNMTSKVDVNDAQLVYNIYNCEYDDFSVANMQKFLYADTSGDMIVDTLDAAAVVNNIP